MKILDNSSAGLNRQIMIVTLVPLVLLSIILTIYFIWIQTSDSKKMLVIQGSTIAKLLSAESNSALANQDLSRLRAISKASLEFSDVADIIFLDSRYQVLQRNAGFDLDLKLTAPSVYHSTKYWYFVQPVSSSKPLTSLYAPPSQTLSSTEVIGWVVVLLSEEQSKLRNQNIILSVIAVIAAILLFAFGFAKGLAKQIMIPINEITSVVEAFQKGNFDARARESHAGKLHTLANGINRMALRIKVSNTDMETRVDSATRRLQSAMHHLEQQNETLETTREKAIEANQAKDQFLARMSHELRTPLTSVLGFSKILQETSITEEQVEPIRIINHTSQLLLSIVDDILDYSKLEKNAITLERIDYNIETAMLDILEMQAPMAHSKGLELSLVSTNGRSYEIKGDPTRFKQIFSNLVSNAIKFTDQGSVAISLDIQHISSHQTLIIISVTDTGIGISDEQLNKLFKAFVQADTSITRRFGGSGLGLVIAKALTKLMGGKLEIYSKQGRGTNMTLQIPTLSNVESNTVASEPFANNKPILIYDNNQHTRRSMGLLLERQSYRYRSLSDLNEFIKLIPSYQHLIIGISATDIKNELIQQVLPHLTQAHTTVTLALPNGHPLPGLPPQVCVVNKPIRPETIIPSDNNQPHLQQTSTKQPNFSSHLSVVVAEDNVFNQILISKILQKHNITPYIASNGKEALALIEQHQPDLAIIDIHMPIMDGFEATKIIRQRGDTPIISLTANIIEKDHIKISAAGSNCIVLKPINDVELIARIRELTKDKPLVADQSGAQSIRDTTPPIPNNEPPLTDTLPLQHNTNIADYDLDQSLLKVELERLLSLLTTAFKSNDTEQMRSAAHQLVGLAGLYELPEVEMTTLELQTAVKAQQVRATWMYLSRLIRIVNNSDLPEQDELDPEQNNDESVSMTGL